MSGPQVDDMVLAVSEETFMENVKEALSNGYERVCSKCGVGTSGDDLDIHERTCPEYDSAWMQG